MPDYTDILVETHGRVGLVRLNRPNAMNALRGPGWQPLRWGRNLRVELSVWLGMGLGWIVYGLVFWLLGGLRGEDMAVVARALPMGGGGKESAAP